MSLKDEGWQNWDLDIQSCCREIQELQRSLDIFVFCPFVNFCVSTSHTSISASLCGKALSAGQAREDASLLKVSSCSTTEAAEDRGPRVPQGMWEQGLACLRCLLCIRYWSQALILLCKNPWVDQQLSLMGVYSEAWSNQTHPHG